MNRISYVGYDAAHPADFRYDIPEGFHNYLLVLTTTPALFRVSGVTSEYPAHTAILYPPYHAIWYGAAGKQYGNHWIRFSSDESFVTKFPQYAVPFSVSDPEYCRSLFQLLTWEASQMITPLRGGADSDTVSPARKKNPSWLHPVSSETNLIISQLLRILCYKLYDDLMNTEGSFHDHELLALRRKISAAPQLPWNTSDMAKELHISVGHLQLIYKQKFGISCMDDVISFRLFRARDLLTYTTHSVAEIAAQCGYNNTEHFCRQFRKNTGLTPGQYRKRSS